MLVVLALGAGSVLRRGEAVTADNLRQGVSRAAAAIAPIAARHQLVISLGGGPQASLLSLQGGEHTTHVNYSPAAIGFETESMVSYMLEQELGNLLPDDRAIVSLLTMAEVDPADPAFRTPTTFIGQLYLREEADFLTARRGWAFRPDGDNWRRVVASPEPKRIVELRSITWLLDHNALVIAKGGGGIASRPAPNRRFAAADCAIDPDLASAVLARELGADRFVLLTHADAVYVDWGSPDQRPIRLASPDALSAVAGLGRAMAAKVSAACHFVRASGRPAAIGAAHDLPGVLKSEAGTTVSAEASGLTFAAAALNARRPFPRPAEVPRAHTR